MKIFAIADPHLSFATPGKSMDVFGPEWRGHPGPMAAKWRERVAERDIVLVAGDISWARRLEGALPDLEFLASLPGRKILIRGNHDYWWSSPSKIRALLPEGMFIIQNDAVTMDGVSFAGTRLWDDPEIRFCPLDLRPGAVPCGAAVPAAAVLAAPPRSPEEDERIFLRELGRLRLSLDRLDKSAALKVALLHFPPTSPDLAPARAVAAVEEAGAAHCVFGHLHALRPMRENPLFGKRKGVHYHLTSCDYLDFAPLEIAEI